VKEPAYSLNALHVERRDIGKRALVWITWIAVRWSRNLGSGPLKRQLHWIFKMPFYAIEYTYRHFKKCGNIYTILSSRSSILFSITVLIQNTYTGD
jgi:hypothetical protein